MERLHCKNYIVMFTGVLLLICGLMHSTPSFSVDVKRIYIVSSYHQSYAPERRTRQGLLSGLTKTGLTETSSKTLHFLETGQLSTDSLIIRQSWLDAARTHSASELARHSAQVLLEIDDFKPHLILLSDNPAIRQIGRTLADSATPIVFLGLNGLPMLYGLVNNIEHPGRNITGVWQTGKHQEALDLLKKLRPEAKRFAILADRSVSALINIKQIKALDQAGALPMQLAGIVQTHQLEDFQQKTLALAKKVDAFYILSHAGLLDDKNHAVKQRSVVSWYLKNITLPSTSNEGYTTLQGMLAAVDDSGYEQAKIAAQMIDAILNRNVSPSILRIRDLKTAQTFVNTQRAQQLGIPIDSQMLFIDRRIGQSDIRQFDRATPVDPPEREGQMP